MVPYEYCMTSATVALVPWILLTNHERYNDWVSKTIANWMQKKKLLFSFCPICLESTYDHTCNGDHRCNSDWESHEWMAAGPNPYGNINSRSLLLRSKHSGCLMSGCLTEAWNEHKNVASESLPTLTFVVYWSQFLELQDLLPHHTDCISPTLRLILTNQGTMWHDIKFQGPLQGLSESFLS
jgi:hypothetical protein